MLSSLLYLRKLAELLMVDYIAIPYGQDLGPCLGCME